MADRHWTIVLVPGGAERSRTVRVPVRAFQFAAGFLAVAAVVSSVLAYVAISRAVDLSRLDRMERRNDVLAEELSQAELLIGEFRDTVNSLAIRDEQVRLLAGLDPTDPQVLLAGVGGPARWTERDQLLSEGVAGRRALEFRSMLNDLVRRANLLAVSYTDAVDSLESHTDQLSRTPSIRPIIAGEGWYTSAFSTSRMHPIFNEARPHEGIDISAPIGTPIHVAANGRVERVRDQPGYGKTVTIHHGYGVRTFYAHASKILVRVGEWVERGDKIAEVGRTGIATAPHVHYEVLVNGRPVDPDQYIFQKSIIY